MNLRVYTRTSSALTVHWNAPTEWGGCALRLYEIEYRNLSKTAKAKAGTKADARADVPWEALGTVDARLEEFAIFQNVWMCDVRVRARNVGAIVPGPWSKVLHVLSPKEAAEDAIKSRHTPGHAGGGGAGSRPPTARAKERPSSARAADGVAQHGMAVVEPTDLKTEAKLEASGHAYMQAQGWSSFSIAIGEVFLETGVNGGCNGQLFDLTPLQVEDLVLSAYTGVADDYLDEEKPLLSFAVIACWVLQTLAHHSFESHVWIPFCNALAGLVHMAAASVSEDAVVAPMVRALLSSLIDVYESLRQCAPNGYVARQLEYHYKKSLRRTLRNDWMAQLARLKEGVATSAMRLVLYGRFKQFKLRKQMLEARAGMLKTRRARSFRYRMQLQRQADEREANSGRGARMA